MTELLGANTDTLDRIAESLSVDARRVQDIRTQAQCAVAELQAGWNGPDLWHLTQEWEQGTSPQLASASMSLDTCAAELRAQSTAQQGASSNDGAGWGSFPAWMASSGWVGIPLLPGPGDNTPAKPPKRGSPTDNATWWRSLSPSQQQQVIAEQPDWIGNRDGVPFTARDQANRALLSVNRARLVAERERLEADLTFNPFEGTYYRDDDALAHVKDKLSSLGVIEQTLARSGQRQLLLLDMSQERAQAAIARGNVDTADNVAVFVPGMTTNVTDSMKGYDDNMDQLQHRAELEDKRVHPTQDLTTATVTWIGYQTPSRAGTSSATTRWPTSTRRGPALRSWCPSCKGSAPPATTTPT